MTARYSRSCLLTVRSVAPPLKGSDVLLRIRQLRLQRHRGCRSGRSVQTRAACALPVLRDFVLPVMGPMSSMDTGLPHAVIVLAEVIETKTWSTFRWYVNVTPSPSAACKSLGV